MSKKPKLLKRIVKHPLFLRFACRLVWAYIHVVHFTSRIHHDIHPDAHAYMDGKHHAISAFWHGRLAMVALITPKNHPMNVLISLHNDGLLIAKVMQYFGVHTVHGSSSKGALAAMRQLLTLLQRGENIAITPDGPRGPFQNAASGIAHIAIRSQTSVVPLAFAATRHKRLRSWDKFMIPLPFTRVIFAVGAPLLPPSNTDENNTEAFRLLVEAKLTEITNHADTLAGISITE